MHLITLNNFKFIEKFEIKLSNLTLLQKKVYLLAAIVLACGLCICIYKIFIAKKLIPNATEISTKKNILSSHLDSAASPSIISTTSVSKLSSKNQKILPFVEKDVQGIKDSIQAFSDEALNVFLKPQPQKPPLDFTLTPEQQKSLLEADKQKFLGKSEPGVKIMRGNCHIVIFLDKVPGFVFKPMDNQTEAENYIEVANHAHKVVSNNNLHLLHVPHSRLIEINGKYFIMQEKADLISGDYSELKGVYSYCWNDKKMNGYIKTVFSQLLEFISQTEFADVKYDNIPFIKDGRVALIDLDSRSLVTGLTAGGAGKNDGLFNYIPYQYFDEFLDIAQGQLKADAYQLFVKKIGPIKTRLQEQVKKKEAYSEFCQKNDISFASQTINPKLLKIFDDKKKQQLALLIVTTLNKDLSISKNLSTQTGRTIHLDINCAGPLFEKAKQIWENQLSYLSSKPGAIGFKNLLPEVLEGLKSSGYIYKYQISRHYPSVRVVC